jgi:hypothetical protein
MRRRRGRSPGASRCADYPGATYHLVYEPRGDVLIGLYTQPAVGQTFEVTFVRQR